MKLLSQIFIFPILIATASAQEPDYDAQILALNQKIEDVRSHICPADGMTEKEVSQHYGSPSGTTNPKGEGGDFDKDGLGVYRWFYKHTARGVEQATGLTTTYPFELVIYFIGGRVVASTIEISPPSIRGYLTATGITTTYSGSPPFPRRGPDGKVLFDHHVSQGEFQFRESLLNWLQKYEASLQKATK